MGCFRGVIGAAAAVVVIAAAMAAALLWEWGNQGSRLAVKCWMRQRLCHQVIVTGLPVSLAASVVIHLHVETMTREDSQITPTNLIRLNPSKAKATFLQSTRTNIFESHLNLAIMAFIGKLSLNTVR